MKTLITVVSVAALARAQEGAWAQCGGQGFTGSTECISGYYCSYINDWYSQCIPGSGSSSSTSTTTTTTIATTTTTSAATSSPTGSSGKLTWVGVNESGAEWGTNFPGTEGVDYLFPNTTAIGVLISEGYNIFRVPFSLERMAVSSLTASLNSAYLTPYSEVIEYITSNGAYAVLDAHNYGRYNGAIITDVDAFETFWANVAAVFKDNSKVIFDINNEYYSMDEDLVLELNQAGIDGIRGAGATTQYIFAEGNSWTGAWTWTTINDDMKALTDPYDKLVYEMHQYLNSDGSGATSECGSSTVGVDRVSGATAWLQTNGKLGVLGEFSAGPSETCLEAVTGMMDHLQENSDVWMGAIWWSAGPGWPAGTYANFEPPSGIAYQYFDSTLKTYAP